MEVIEKLSDYDAAWKEALDEFFPEFMEFFFSEAYQEINWSKKYEILDSELQKIVHDSNLGKRHADKLIKVFLNDNTETVILIHIEVQGDYDSDFSERMYVYNYRIFDKYLKLGESKTDLVSLAILGDFNENWNPKSYQRNRWNCELSFSFPVVKLNNYRHELEESKSPFALVALAYLNSKETHNRYDERLVAKLNLIRNLLLSGWEREKIAQLFKFVDWMVILPNELKSQFKMELQKLEEESQMTYITSIEQDGIEKGIEKEAFRRAKKSIILVLEAKFGDVAEEIKNSLENINDINRLENLLQEAVKTMSIDDFANLLTQEKNK